MILLEKRFKLSDEFWGPWWKHGDTIVICVNRLRKYFAIPAETKTIWISLHDIPAADRVEVFWRQRRCGYASVRPRLAQQIDAVGIEVWRLPGVSEDETRTVYAQVVYEV